MGPPSDVMTEADDSTDESVVVIGAGQSGLATGSSLRQAGIGSRILADDERSGDTWRDRWDSLELFTPAHSNGLPGPDFPADDPEHLPQTDEMADSLEAYAEAFDFQIEPETRVTLLAREVGRFVLEESGEPRHPRGVVEEAPGLCFVGLRWVTRPASSLTGGVGPDAEHIAEHVREAAE